MASSEEPLPVGKDQIELLRQFMGEDPAKRELLTCLSDGMWHTTTELARRASAKTPVMGMVTVGTVLARLEKQLGPRFFEQMVQRAEQGVSSWRMGVEWLEVVRDILKETE